MVLSSLFYNEKQPKFTCLKVFWNKSDIDFAFLFQEHVLLYQKKNVSQEVMNGQRFILEYYFSSPHRKSLILCEQNKLLSTKASFQSVCQKYLFLPLNI